MVGSGSLAALAGAPWWSVLIGEAGVVVVAALYLMMPQDSADRLEWWRLWGAPRPRRTAVSQRPNKPTEAVQKH